MNTFELKKITLVELVQLQEIGRKTFLETFSSYNTEENMKTYLKKGFSIDKLSNELENLHSEFYFATQNEVVIGYLKINFGPAQTEIQDNKSLEIERIYVLQEFHGQKIGQLLFEKAIAIAKNNHCEYVWLGVWEENHRALQFYTKNGFVTFDKHVFVFGNEEQTDIMMKLLL
jgi:ribosomal protein S18 acetylase RimI-like enzyme